MARVLICRHCGVHWAARKGTIDEFFDAHAKSHNLGKPVTTSLLNDTAAQQIYIDNLVAWRKEHFDDSFYKTADIHDEHGAA